MANDIYIDTERETSILCAIGRPCGSGSVRGVAIGCAASGIQSCNTREMIFPVARLISFISEFVTLEPGDVIATGTPSGVGGAHQPPRWLKAGETVRVEIPRLGALANLMVPPA